MNRSSLKKSLLALAAVCLAVAPAAPALAGGGHHGGGHHGGHHGDGHHDGGHHGGHHGGGHYGYGGYGYGGYGYGHGGYGYSSHDYYYGSYGYSHHDHHDHHDHHGHHGHDGALIAAGIIGGAILIDGALDREQERSYYRRYDPDYGRSHASPPSRDFYYRRGERSYDGGDEFEDNRALEDELAGGGAASGTRYNYGAAYNDCKAETRDAARDSGLLVALPARPRGIDPIDDGAAVRFTADVIASDVSGAEYRRIMTCEADKGGVRFLELS